jgi:hypothetical protein
MSEEKEKCIETQQPSLSLYCPIDFCCELGSAGELERKVININMY